MKGRGKKLSILLLTATVLALGSGAALADGWTFSDLSLQGDIVGKSTARAINNNGDVVGYAGFAGDDQNHAVLWSGGVAYNLGALGGGSGAVAINDAGVIGGGTMGSKAALFSIGAEPVIIHPYDIPYSVNTSSGIADINNSGQMVGSVDTDLLGMVPLLWSDPETYTILDAGPLNIGGTHHINELGQISGWTAVDQYARSGNWLGWFLRTSFWDADGTLTQLGTFDGKHCLPGGLNDLGQMAINVDNGNAYVAWSYVWQDGAIGERLADLGGGYTHTYAINNDGLIVGTASTADGTHHAVLWQDGEIIDLNDLVAGTGLILDEALDINDQGQIVGKGYKDGIDFAFLLTPNLTPTPVPASVLLFGSGLAGLALFRRRTQA